MLLHWTPNVLAEQCHYSILLEALRRIYIALLISPFRGFSEIEDRPEILDDANDSDDGANNFDDASFDQDTLLDKLLDDVEEVNRIQAVRTSEASTHTVVTMGRIQDPQEHLQS